MVGRLSVRKHSKVEDVISRMDVVSHAESEAIRRLTVLIAMEAVGGTVEDLAQALVGQHPTVRGPDLELRNADTIDRGPMTVHEDETRGTGAHHVGETSVTSASDLTNVGSDHRHRKSTRQKTTRSDRKLQMTPTVHSQQVPRMMSGKTRRNTSETK
jgi:hypothetical protein